MHLNTQIDVSRISNVTRQFDFDGNETTKVLVEFLRKPHYQTRGKETERRKKESGRMSPQKKFGLCLQ